MAVRYLVFLGFLGIMASCKARETRQNLQKTTLAIPQKKIVRDVDVVEKISSLIKKKLEQALRPGMITSEVFSENFVADWPKETSWTKYSNGQLEIHYQGKNPDFEKLGKEAFIKKMTTSIGALSKVDRSHFAIIRNFVALSKTELIADAHVEIGGTNQEGQSLSEWRATLRVAFTQKENQWRLTHLQPLESVFSRSNFRKFRDVSKVLGISLPETRENIRNAKSMVNNRKSPSSGGISVTDFNNDGAPDILVTRRNRGTSLFVNDKSGGYTRLPLEAFNDPSESAKFYLWVDLDNDGDEDLVSTRSGQARNGLSFVTLYRREGNELIKKEDILTFREDVWKRGLDYQGITSCDVDGNGFLDLIFVGYTHLESGLQNSNFVHGTDGLRNLIFLNYGKLDFREEGIERGVTETLYSFVAACQDFDGDGDVDFFVGNDYGQNHFYKNNGKGGFTNDISHPFHQGRGFSMGVSIADFNNTGSYAVSLSNMYSHAGNRIIPLADNLSPKMREVLEGYAAGNSLFENKDGQWTETALERHVEYAQWAWGNIFFDFDNDRDQDLYVVNGFTSHEDPNAPDF